MKFTILNTKGVLLFILLLVLTLLPLRAQRMNGRQMREVLATSLEPYMSRLCVGKARVKRVIISRQNKTLKIYLNDQASYLPFRKETVKEILVEMRKVLPATYKSYKLLMYAQGQPVQALMPGGLIKKFTTQIKYPLVTPLSRSFTPSKGMLYRHIALWQSHGYYYEQSLSRWEWQRARSFQTVEDLYPQSYVLPFLVPMLENAGANVLLPRERDFQKHEVIVDNDEGIDIKGYAEVFGTKAWQTGEGKGFAHLHSAYDKENPFSEGTYRVIPTTKKGNPSKAIWTIHVPESGDYAVYVAYKSLPNSAEDAHYIVHHKAGKSEFLVNQTMGGGTWIYLGRFSFDSSHKAYVELSNFSMQEKKRVTADAIKVGGGTGNIARYAPGFPAEVSGYPRFTEGARYWLQWAGMPPKVYTPMEGKDDYRDDYKSRAIWVNYLAGGSTVLPDSVGMKVPIDLSFAFHTDAGITPNDSIIGTLGIYCTKDEKHRTNGKYANGASRFLARHLTDYVQSQIVNDIRSLYEPKWSRRGMWNKSYYEARVPQVPAMLLELLSHHNFADMRYGLDPRFRFTVSRAIYKGMLRYFQEQYGQTYVVQPLPVDHFSLQFAAKNQVKLAWRPVIDSLEVTAEPTSYIVYMRKGEQGVFDQGRVVKQPFMTVKQEPGVQYSYKVTAVNAGGQSFPSEVLAAYYAPVSRGKVCIINGFDRISAPDDFVACDSVAGFLDAKDHGVPYKYDISYIGSQYEFDRREKWRDDDATGFGASRANYETRVVAGNTFDYPAMHGRSLAKANYSYVSCSDESVEQGIIDLKDFEAVDFILGKEKEIVMARGCHAAQFKTYTKAMQEKLSTYCEAGGNLFISGAYVASDLWDKPQPIEEDITFAEKVLGYTWRTNQATILGSARCVAIPHKVGATFTGGCTFYDVPNEQSYVVESPDAIEPVKGNKMNYTIMRYNENNLSAAIAYQGDKQRTVVMGFPFEAIKKEADRNRLMREIMAFFTKK